MRLEKEDFRVAAESLLQPLGDAIPDGVHADFYRQLFRDEEYAEKATEIIAERLRMMYNFGAIDSRNGSLRMPGVHDGIPEPENTPYHPDEDERYV